MKLKRVGELLFFYCPACKRPHAFTDRVHQFNGDMNNPTVKPSILLTNPKQHQECHLYITNGIIEYCEDKCWHDMAGKKITLPDFPDDIFTSP